MQPKSERKNPLAKIIGTSVLSVAVGVAVGIGIHYASETHSDCSKKQENPVVQPTKTQKEEKIDRDKNTINNLVIVLEQDCDYMTNAKELVNGFVAIQENYPGVLKDKEGFNDQYDVSFVIDENIEPKGIRMKLESRFSYNVFLTTETAVDLTKRLKDKLPNNCVAYLK